MLDCSFDKDEVVVVLSVKGIPLGTKESPQLGKIKDYSRPLDMWLIEEMESKETYWVRRKEITKIKNQDQFKRIWVIASLKHAQNGILEFYGTYTEDSVEKRSTSGYNMDLETCEKFRECELKNHKHIPFYGEKTLYEILNTYEKTLKIKIEDLPKIAVKKTNFKIN